jgi:hypothetical protein
VLRLDAAILMLKLSSRDHTSSERAHAEFFDCIYTCT